MADMDRIQQTYFTDDKVDDYLTNKLHFPNWKITLERDRLEFLTKLQQKSTTYIYFQNIRMCSVPVESRAPPTAEQIAANGFSGCGGVCYELNYFLHLLLTELGFDTFVVAATFVASLRDCHLIPIVRLEEGLYLMDVAAAHPLDVPVPLHQLPHKRQAGGCGYEFAEHVSETIEITMHARYQLAGNFFQDQASDDPNRREMRFEFDLTPRTLEYFASPMRAIFTNPNCNPFFLKCPFMFRYLKLELDDQLDEPDGDDNQWALLLGMKIVFGSKTERKTVRYQNYAEVMEAIDKYFPGMDKEQMRLAFEHFRLEQENRAKIEDMSGM